MNRFIAVGSKSAAEVHSSCGTCPFWFTVVPEGVDASALVTAAREETERGLVDLDAPVVDDIAAVMPSGNYHVALLRGIPERVEAGSWLDYFWTEGRKGWPGAGFQEKSGYYRAGTRPVSVPYDREATLFEFIVPLQPLARLDPDRIEHYRRILREGHAPTAIALSAYDTKASMEVDVEHLIATNFLVDGHHKVEAAHLEGKEITVLAFISTALAWNQDPLEAHRAIAGGHELLPLWSPEGLPTRVAAISDILARHDPLRLPPRPDGFPKDLVWRDYRWEANALASLLNGLQYPPSIEDLISILAEQYRESIAQGTLNEEKLAAIAQDLYQHGLT